MLARLIIVFSSLSLVAASAFAIGRIVTDTPAFSKKVRQSGVSGDWRVLPGSAMYHRGDYLLYQGLGFLKAAEVDPGDNQEESGVSDANLGLQQAAIAEDLFRQSLDLSPAQPKAWTSLAWSEILQGNAEQAKLALKNSWKLAPFNVVQASSRLALADLLSDLADSDKMFDATAEKAALNDLRTIQRYQSRLFTAVLNGSERLKSLALKGGLDADKS